jgi:hypothetical protein
MKRPLIKVVYRLAKFFAKPSATAAASLLALDTLGDVTHRETILFASHLPRKPRQVILASLLAVVSIKTMPI